MTSVVAPITNLQDLVSEEERIAARNAVLHLSKKVGQHHPRLIAKVLAGNQPHPFVKLDGNDYGDEGVRYIATALKGNTGVQGIDLSSNKITSIGAKKLAESIEDNKALLSLRLEDNPIQDEGVQAIAETLRKNQTLTSLHLTSCPFTTIGVRALASALEENNSLQVLILSGVPCGDDGAVGLGRSLATNTSLRVISLYDCKIGDKGGNAILAGLKRNKESQVMNINLRRNEISQDIVTQIYEIAKGKRVLYKSSQDGAGEKGMDPEVMRILDEREKALREREEALLKMQQELSGKTVELQTKEKEMEKEAKDREKELEKNRKKLDKEAKERERGEGGSWSLFKHRSKVGEEYVCMVVGDNLADKNQFLSLFTSMVGQHTSTGAERSADRVVSGQVKVDSKISVLTLMNTSGDDKNSRIRSLQYEQAQLVVIVFSLTDIVSFEDVEFQWLSEIRFVNQKLPIMLVGVNAHLRSAVPSPTEVSTEMGSTLATRIGAAGYFEVSNVEGIASYQKAIEAMIKELKKKKK